MWLLSGRYAFKLGYNLTALVHDGNVRQAQQRAVPVQLWERARFTGTATFSTTGLKDSSKTPTAYSDLVMGVPREGPPSGGALGELCVARSPDAVASFIKQGFTSIVIENGACEQAYFITGRARQQAHLSSFLGYLYPASDKGLIGVLARRKATARGMDCIPRTISSAPGFDSRSSMANIAGYRHLVTSTDLMELQAQVQTVSSAASAVADQLVETTDESTKAYLRQKELSLLKSAELLREKELIIMRAAAGPGPGRAGAGGAGARAQAPRLLVDQAAKLHPWPAVPVGSAWELRYADSSKLFVDSAKVVEHIRSWARLALLTAGDRSNDRPPPPLVVSGLVKTGKSFTQEHVVPAVVAEAIREQGAEGAMAGAVLFRLNAGNLDRTAGATVMLRDLLGRLLMWARTEHVPVQEGALQAAEDVLVRTYHVNEPHVPGNAIRYFLESVEVPVLVLCDEVQSLFLPTFGSSDKQDEGGAVYIRDSLIKYLLLYGTHNVLWCLTGSSMAQTWISIADMPPNGYTLSTAARVVDLPSSYSREPMLLAWEQLQCRYSRYSRELDPMLLQLCMPSIALLTMMTEDWVCSSRQHDDVAAFVLTFNRTKLVDESLKEWRLGLARMPLSQRRAVLDLAFPGVGARIDTDLHYGLRHLLEPHLEKMANGRWYLKDRFQRQILRLLFNKDATLRDSWSDEEFSATLAQLDGGWVMLRLGETADYLLGPSANHRWKGKQLPAWVKDFKDGLQDIANAVASKLASSAAGGGALNPNELWERQPWFQNVLESEYNSVDRKRYNHNKQARDTHLDMLIFYLRLSRNILAHQKPWNSESSALLVDVSVIEALPTVLGQPLDYFIDVLEGLLLALPSCTVGDGENAVVKELSAGSGGSGGAGGGSNVSGGGGGGSNMSGGAGGSAATGGSSRGGGGLVPSVIPDRCAPVLCP